MATASVMPKNAASVLVLCTDAGVRARLRKVLAAQRWEVHEADGGAAALLLMEQTHPHATLFPVQTLISTLQRMGVNVPTTGSANSLRVQNMAAVFIAATLPPFAEPGTKLDITVSSAGDARSLNGGLLLMAACC